MDIKEFLSSSDILVDVRASDKTQLLQELARRAATRLNLAAEQISVAILQREALGSTGTGGGVAIPHARIQGLKRTFGILARLNKPIDFEAIDSRPVDLVFLLLLPAESAGVQLNALASVARKLRGAACLRSLRSASGAADLYDVMTA